MWVKITVGTKRAFNLFIETTNYYFVRQTITQSEKIIVKDEVFWRNLLLYTRPYNNVYSLCDFYCINTKLHIKKMQIFGKNFI